MLGKIIAAFKSEEATPETDDPKKKRNLAAAALLVEVALQDDEFDDREREIIQNILVHDLEVKESKAGQLIEEAREKVAKNVGLYRATSTIRETFDEGERVDLMEMLWEVVLADGEQHHYEANLLRRIAGLIYVSDQESGAARKRALDRLGLSE